MNLLLAGGAGYILIGQKAKGIVAIVLFFAVAWPTCFSASGLIAFIAAVDGYMQAQSLEEGHAIGQWTFFREHR
jgi:TM2 domain-containing membrane protein YozV